MKLAAISELLDCRMIVAPEGCLEREVDLCLGSDMMSDVLAFGRPGALLVTGLINSQSVRTADVADAGGIVYIRGKDPDAQAITLAEGIGIPLLATQLGMFDACALLADKGVKGIG